MEKNEREQAEKELRAETWQDHRSQFQPMNLATAEAGHHAINAAMWLNGGTTVVLFGFLAAVIAQPELRQSISAAVVQMALLCFGGGALLAVMAQGSTYLTDLFYTRSHANAELIWEFPYVKQDTKASVRYRRLGVLLHFLTTFAVIGSYVLFAYGGYQVVTAVKW